MEWFNKHADTVVIIGAIVSSMLWMNGKFNEIDHRFSKVDHHFSDVEKEIAIIKTVLIMKNIMPSELANSKVENKD